MNQSLASQKPGPFLFSLPEWSKHEKMEVMEIFTVTKNFELLRKSLRFKCENEKCDQNDKSFFSISSKFSQHKIFKSYIKIL